MTAKISTKNTPVKSLNHFVTLNNRKYFYSLRKVNSKTTYFECEAANISQPFQNEDIAELLIDLPNLILSEKEYLEKQNIVIRFRVNVNDKKLIEEKASKNGFKTISDYLREVATK